MLLQRTLQRKVLRYSVPNEVYVMCIAQNCNPIDLVSCKIVIKKKAKKKINITFPTTC